MRRLPGISPTVTMEDVAQCIEEILQHSPYRQFWVQFHSEVKDGAESNEDGISLTIQQRARLKLFKEITQKSDGRVTVVADQESNGYILSITEAGR